MSVVCSAPSSAPLHKLGDPAGIEVHERGGGPSKAAHSGFTLTEVALPDAVHHHAGAPGGD